MGDGKLLYQPANSDRPTVASDLEGTLSEGQLWRGLQRYLREHGQVTVVRRHLLRFLPQVLLFRLGWLKNEMDFKENWVLGILRLFRGYTEPELAAVGEWAIAQELWPQRRTAVLDELNQYKANGHRVLLLSGMFEPMMVAFAKRAGFEAIGTSLKYDENGRFTGEIVGSLNAGERKVAQLRPFARDGKIVAAFGDTERDIPMLMMAERAVAVAPDAKLRQVAAANNWEIIEDS